MPRQKRKPPLTRMAVSLKRGSEENPVFGGVVEVLAGGAVEVELHCRCMRCGGYYRHEQDAETEVWAAGEYRFADERDIPHLVNTHYKGSHPGGYFLLYGAKAPRPEPMPWKGGIRHPGGMTVN